ncbi:non-homologous end-joining DNA ligase [Desulforudis sp. 1088]|uniref:non-homologous end-joining DNA ligase n=1 Tax=unclassified Candidatus Desulforudis TaxID=2635950 RepID=UPI0034965D61
MTLVQVRGRRLGLTNLNKVYWPDGRTKGDLIAYYTAVGEYAIRYLEGRPVVMSRYPDGITGKHFYQKERPESTPEWIETVPVAHDEGMRIVNYVVYRGLETLVWLANLGCIEMHSWISKVGTLAHPDIAVIDLDPAEGATFEQVVEVARLARTALREFGLNGFPKTSGATGLHVFIPVEPRHTFSEVTRAMKIIAEFIVRICPFATIERIVSKRTGKVYVDYLQNTFGKAMAFPYSVRPRPGAPVSAPLRWEELERPAWRPDDFNMDSMPERLRTAGDLYEGFFDARSSLEGILALG